MREFLLELYLEHGEREFEWLHTEMRLLDQGYIEWANSYTMNQKITTKAIEYIKNLDNP